MSPAAALRPCLTPRCGSFRPCPTHDRAREQARRPAWVTRFYSSTAWKKTRGIKRQRDPLCEDCRDAGRITPMREVDHVIPLTTRPDLGLVIENLRALCVDHHSAKTRGVGGPRS